MTLNQKQAQEKYAKGSSKQAPSEALERATNELGLEQGTELYNQAKAETIANSIISNTDYLFKSGTEKYNKEMSDLATKGLTLSKEYNEKKISISNNNDLTKEGKTKQLNELYNTYNTQTKETIEAQIKLKTEHNKSRGNIAQETLQLIDSEASINDFSDKEMSYILYMAQNGNNEMLLGLLEQFNFNPVLINILNARDAKESDYKDGKLNTEKLEVVHPLAYIQEKNIFIAPNELYTDIGTRTLQTLIPTDGIPSMDIWANITDEKAKEW